MKNDQKSFLGEIFSMFWDIWKEMFRAAMDVLPKAISLFFWILAGIVILPCVLVANYWYPTWVEWGEKF